MNKIRRLVATLGLAAGLVVSSAGLASAQRWTHADSAHDVVTYDQDTDEPVTVPERTAGDVVLTTISHTRSKVVIRIRMRAVPRGDWMAMAEVRTPRASYYLQQLTFGEGRRFSISKVSGDRRDSGRVRCAAKSSRIDRTALVLSVPRSCLGNPRWIRASATTITFQTAADIDEEEQVMTAYTDEALSPGYAYGMRLSPPLRRG